MSLSWFGWTALVVSCASFAASGVCFAAGYVLERRARRRASRWVRPGTLGPGGRTEQGMEPEDAVAEVLGDVVLVRWEEITYGGGVYAPGFYPARVVGVGGAVPDSCGFARGDRVLAARRREALEWVPTATRALGAVPIQDVVAVLR